MPRPLVAQLFAVNAVRDADGRPLGEMRASPSARAGVEMDLRTCPYAGARHGLPMNASALRQMQAHWPALLDALRAMHAGIRGAMPARAWEWRDAFAVSTACVSWAVLAHVRAQTPSSVQSIVYKVAVGVHALLKEILTRVAIGAPGGEAIPETPDATWALAFAERSGRLVADGEACAGPPARLLEAVAAIVDEVHDAARPTLALEPAYFSAAAALSAQQVLGLAATWTDSWWEHAVLSEFVAREPRDVEGTDPLRDRVWEQLEPVARRVRPQALRAGVLRATAWVGADLGADWCAIGSVDPQDVAALLALRRGAPGVRMQRPTEHWWASAALSYARFRCAHLSTFSHLEGRVSEALSLPPIPLTAEHGELFGRLHGQAWLEVLGGVSLEITADGLRASTRHGEHVVDAVRLQNSRAKP